jgi:hypothetical protein
MIDKAGNQEFRRWGGKKRLKEALEVLKDLQSAQ